MPLKVKLGIAAVAIALVALVALFLLSLRSQRPGEVGLVEGHLRPCPPTPNCVCSEGPDAAIEPLAFQGEPEEARERLLALLADLPRVEVEASEPTYVHAVFRTALFRFADDVEFRIDAAARRIHVRSASRVGRSDLGANRARVEDLRARWDR